MGRPKGPRKFSREDAILSVQRRRQIPTLITDCNYRLQLSTNKVQKGTDGGIFDHFIQNPLHILYLPCVLGVYIVSRPIYIYLRSHPSKAADRSYVQGTPALTICGIKHEVYLASIFALHYNLEEPFSGLGRGASAFTRQGSFSIRVTPELCQGLVWSRTAFQPQPLPQLTTATASITEYLPLSSSTPFLNHLLPMSLFFFFFCSFFVSSSLINPPVS